MCFETNDTYLSGYLMAMGLELKSHAARGGNTIFRFEQNSQLEQLVELYYSFAAQINPQRYGAALKMLKNLIYQSKDKNNNNGNESTYNSGAK